MNNLTLVNNIKSLCKENNISVSQLERELLMSPGLISRWTKNVPTLDRITEVAEYFNVSLDFIVGNATAHQNVKTITRLLSILYDKSINADIDWDVFDVQQPVSELSSSAVPPLDSNEDCFYCSVNSGFFFLVIRYEGSDGYSLAFYALADRNSCPELECSDTEKLKPLYKYLTKRLSSRLNQVKTTNFINAFIESTSVVKSTSDTKIAAIPQLNEIVYG